MTALEPLRWFWLALRDWRWRHSGAAMLVGVLTLSNMGGALFFAADFPWLRSYTYNALQFGLPCVLWLLWADRAVQLGGWPAWLSYGVGVPIVASLGVWFLGPRISDLIGGDANWNTNNDRMLAAAVMVPLALVTAGAAFWQRSQRAQAALRQSHEEREAQAQALSAAKLLALQARMEPQLLFDTLTRIRDQVGVDDAQADATLLDLIALLRAMQPHAQASTSSLGRELALIEGFGKVAQQPQLLAPFLRVQADEAAKAMALAPSLLLPLLRSLMEAQPGHWQIDARLAAGKLELRLRSEAASPPQTDLRQFAERLSLVHGASASLKRGADGIDLGVPATPNAATKIMEDLDR